MTYYKKVKVEESNFPYQLTEWQKDWIGLCWIIVRLDPFKELYNKEYIVIEKEGEWAIFTEGVRQKVEGNKNKASSIDDEEFYWDKEDEDKWRRPKEVLDKLKTL